MARFARRELATDLATVATVCLTLAALASPGCRDRERAPAPARAEVAAPKPPPPHERELAALRAFEDQRRASVDFATLAPSDVALGPDPYRIAALHDGKQLVGLLRGESAVVMLDDNATELSRDAAPRSPSGLAVSGEDDVLVVGELASELAHYRVVRGRLTRVATLPIAARALRSVALSSDARTAYLAEEHDGRVLAISLERDRSRAFRATATRELSRCHGPVQVESVPGYVAVNCLLDHEIEIRPDAGDPVRIHHDGPMWSFALRREPDGGLVVAAGGVEDHPLVREDGGFGYIDSYLYLYRLAPGAAKPQRLTALNTSELGVVTPKWLAIQAPDASSLAVTVTGYASATAITATWRGGDFAAAPTTAPIALLPGTAAAQRLADGSFIVANPLFDAWVVERGGAPSRVPAASTRPQRPVQSRIGELLFFTSLMAPWNSSEGKLSRFTCETCHHEGYVDGRVHFTGRDTVHAATRPLYGLFNNRPHFSRALDKTMASMVHAEFRVANRHNGRDPWFALTRADVPWLEHVDGAPAELPGELLREAFMSFLMDFTHRSNPAAIDHARFTELERTGATAFRDRCARCHTARLVADDAKSLVPFERWEALVLSSSGGIVWGSDAYEKTGVLPYVNASGARVPTLRRLYKKWPYLTNGSAHSLDDVLDRFAVSPAAGAGAGGGSAAATYHDGAPADAAVVRLTADEKTALRAFLDLL